MRRSLWIGPVLVSALLGAIGFGTGGAADAAPTLFTTRGSVNQVYVFDAISGATAELLDSTDTVIATTTVDSQGGALFRDASVDVVDSGVRIPAGGGYRVRVGAEVSDPVTVLDRAVAPDQSFYDEQTIGEGFGYLETRDGTLLSINVSIPPGPRPHPTVIEYSGYSPSNPASPSQVLTPLQVQGYATVSVNMRGTGCSGGAFWYWEPLQALDGYDMVEAIGAQPWSANIGMAGISYSGISQLYVASTQPPSLDAITPLSVIVDTYRSTLYPGGILNDGFALDWAIDRVEDAQPYALGWVNDQIAGGDTVCNANQQLRLQSMDILSEITHVRYWEDRATVLAPWSFIDQIEVPTFLVGAWQDEQTGPHFGTMLDRFDPTTKTRFVLTNGTHMEGLGPSYIGHLLEWLDFYVAEKIPEISPIARAFAPALFADILGKGTDLPPDRFTGYADYGSALAAFEAEAETVDQLGLGQQAAFGVSALFASGYGPASSPSALASVSVLPPPSTTTSTTVVPSPTTTAVPSTTTAASTADTATTAVAPTSPPTTPGGAVVLPKTVVAPTSGALPVTGGTLLPVALSGLVLLLGGVTVLALRRR